MKEAIKSFLKKRKQEKLENLERQKDWQQFRGLMNEEIEKKLEKLPEDEMLAIYKTLEREAGYRIDPENYKPHRIKKCFMILWTRKLEDEEREAKVGERLVPLTETELDRIWSADPGGRISKPGFRINE